MQPMYLNDKFYTNGTYLRWAPSAWETTKPTLSM